MSVVLVVIALLWLSAVGVWPLLAALLACSSVWAGGGAEAEVVAAGALAWTGAVVLRRWARSRLHS